MAKAALVDAISTLRLSTDNLTRYQEIMEKGAGVPSELKARQQKLELDTNALNSAERSLRMWKLTNKDIEEIKAEAKSISDQKKARSVEEEAKRWARVEIRAPIDEANPNNELVVVEKNVSLGETVDPVNSPPLFKLADMSRLQILVQPPVEYLPLIQEGLEKYGPGRLQWDIRCQSEPPETPPQRLDIITIAPSLDPNLRTPLVLGYLPNPKGKYRIGEFVTATIYVPPDENTVEIPTNALNEVEGQAFVFVQPDPKEHDYMLRRVAVVRRFKDVTFVRSRLTDEEKRISQAEAARGRRPLEPLLPGERVITNGVVLLTTALEDLATKQRVARTKAAHN
jgi:cobalt-zinc-cadmium efflux system membrane fusion protein